MVSSVHENHRTHRTFPKARPKCLMKDFTNLNRIYTAHQTNVWWIMKVFRVHWVSTCNWCWCGWWPLLIEGRCGRAVLQEPEWPASVVAIFGYRELISRYREIHQISRYRKINCRYPKIISRYREIDYFPISEIYFLISGNDSRYREMLNKNPNGFP